MSPLKLLIDLAGGAALAFMLVLVLIFDLVVNRWLAPADHAGPNTLEVRVITDAREALGGEQKKLRLAVLSDPGDPVNKPNVVWDDMGSLLNQLGEGYQHDLLRTKDLLDNPNLLSTYDVLFFTCAPGGEQLRDPLVNFVSSGGILYASDWRYDAVANAFPELVDKSVQHEGVHGSVTADVVDPGLREAIGPQIHLKFDLPRWKTAAFTGPRVTVLMQGNYRRWRGPNHPGTPATAPLLVKFPIGKGQVIFTSFHNEKQTSETEKKLLQYLVFTMVTAGVDAEVQSQISEGGFAPQRSNLLSTPKKNMSVTKTFQNAKTGPVRFGLAFRNEGAQLKLHIRSPQGKDYTWEGTSTVILEVPQAAAGEWTYTITALHLPYENFPFTVTVGAKQ